MSSGARSKASLALKVECDAAKKLLSDLGDLCQGRVLEEKDPEYLPKVYLEDQIMGCGERLSASFLAILLEDRGTPAEYIDLSHVLSYNDQYPNGVNDESVQRLSNIIKQKVTAGNTKVPVSGIPKSIVHDWLNELQGYYRFLWCYQGWSSQ